MKIVVTGLGVCSPLGVGIESNWKNLVDCSLGTVPNNAYVRDWGLSPEVRLNGFLRAKELASAACSEALSDAGFSDEIHPERLGSTLSASKPFLNDDGTVVPAGKLHDFIKRQFHCSGESRNIIAACATGAYSVAIGASWIEQGLCDAVLAGSVEPYPHPLYQAGFRQMGVLSSDGVTRPFDRRRSGFHFGEGAGAFVLESEAHAKNRGAEIYARLSGWAMGADSHSTYVFNSNGSKIAGVIERALERGQLSPQDVRHVNAHGTATRRNDWIETQSLIKAFGPHAKNLMISATKASTGHLLGASGSVEFVFTILALMKQFVPPTATLEERDAECPLDYTARKGHSASFNHALSLSFGFGGPIGALVVSGHE